MSLNCTSTIDVTSIIQPLLLKSVFKEGEMNIDALIDVLIQ